MVRLTQLYIQREGRNKQYSAKEINQAIQHVEKLRVAVIARLQEKIQVNKNQIKRKIISRASKKGLTIYDSNKKISITDMHSISQFQNGLLSLDQAVQEHHGKTLHDYITEKTKQPKFTFKQQMLGSTKDFSEAAMKSRIQKGGQGSLIGEIDAIEMQKKLLDEEEMKWRQTKLKAIENSKQYKNHKYSAALHEMNKNFITLVIVSTIGLFTFGLAVASGILSTVGVMLSRALYGLLGLLGRGLSSIGSTVRAFFQRLFQAEELVVEADESAQAIEAQQNKSLAQRSAEIAEELKVEEEPRSMIDSLRQPDLVQKQIGIQQKTQQMIGSMMDVVKQETQMATAAAAFQTQFDQITPQTYEIQQQSRRMMESTFHDMGMNESEADFIVDEIIHRADDQIGLHNNYYQNLEQEIANDQTYNQRVHSQAYTDVLSSLFYDVYHDGQETFLENNSQSQAFEDLRNELDHPNTMDYVPATEYTDQELYDMALQQQQNQQLPQVVRNENALCPVQQPFQQIGQQTTSQRGFYQMLT